MQLGIDFGGTAMKLGVVDHGRVVASSSLAIRGELDDLERARAAAMALMAGMSSDVDSVGIAVPGIVDQRRGRMVRANDKYEALANVDLIEWATSQFGVPAVLENDARAALLGEATYGAAVGSRDVVLVTLGTGIGTAALIGGSLLRGSHDHAGVLGGHVTVSIDGPVCPCGNVGCAEALASSWALRHTDRGMAASLRDLVELAPAQAPLLAVLDRYLRVWGATVVTMCHMYDPEVVVLTGGVMRAGQTVLGPIEAYVQEHLWASAYRPRIVVPDEPTLSVVRGLAALAETAAQKRNGGQGSDLEEER